MEVLPQVLVQEIKYTELYTAVDLFCSSTVWKIDVIG